MKHRTRCILESSTDSEYVNLHKCHYNHSVLETAAHIHIDSPNTAWTCTVDTVHASEMSCRTALLTSLNSEHVNSIRSCTRKKALYSTYCPRNIKIARDGRKCNQDSAMRGHNSFMWLHCKKSMVILTNKNGYLSCTCICPLNTWH